MNEVYTGIALIDDMTAPIMSMINSLDWLEDALNIVDNAANIDTSALGGLEDALNAVNNVDNIDMSGLNEMQYALVNLADTYNAVNNAADIDTSSMLAMQVDIRSADASANILIDSVLSIESTLRGMAAAQLDFISGSQQVAPAYEGIQETAEEILNNIDNTIGAQNNFNNSARQGDSIFDDLLGKITTATAAYASIHTVDNVLDLSDEMAQTTARLNLMNDGLQSTFELQNMVFAAAQRSRGEYSLMADSVASLGLQASSAFSNNDEIIEFVELMNKNFKIGGQDINTQAAAMRQLTQAMSSGRLMGDEFVSVMEGAPLLAQAIADQFDTSVAAVKELSGEGAITSQVIKNALFSMGDEIDTMFEEIPVTFEEITNQLEDRAVMAFQPFLQQLNNVANSDAFQTLIDNATNKLNEIADSQTFQMFANGAVNALYMVSGAALKAFDIATTAAGFVGDNWSIIAPIISGVAFAFGLYSIAVAANTIFIAANTIAQGFAAIAEYSSAKSALAHAAALTAEQKAAATATIANASLNTTLLASPVTWVVGGLIAIVAAVYAVTAAYNEWTDSTVSATGLILGTFGVWWAAVFNNVILPFQHTFAAVANFFGNVFNDPVTAIQALFADLAVNVVGHISRMANAAEDIINQIPGVEIDITGGIDSLYSKLQEHAATVKASGEWIEYVTPWTGKDYEESWNAGYEMGEGIDETIKNFNPEDLFKMPPMDNFPPENPYEDLPGMAGNLNNIDNNTRKQLDYTEEEIKLWRDIASRDTISRHTTVQVSLGGMSMTNNVSSDVDVDGMINKFTDVLEQRMFEAAEGVHF